MDHSTKTWTWEEGMEYVFYGIAAIAIWTIINVFITLTSERDLDEMEETGLPVRKSEPTREENRDKNAQERYAARFSESEDIPSGDNTLESEGKVQWDELVDESTTEDDVENDDTYRYPEAEVRTEEAKKVPVQEVTVTEGNLVVQWNPFMVEVGDASAKPEDTRGPEEDDSSQRVDPEEVANDGIDQEVSKPECCGKSEEEQKEEDENLDMKSNIFVHDHVSSVVPETCTGESEEDVSNLNSVMDWKELEVEVVREDDGEGSEDSSDYEVLLIDAPPLSTDDDECEELEDVTGRDQTSQELLLRSNDKVDDDFVSETSGDAGSWTSRGSIPKIVIVDESGQDSRNPEMEGITAFRESEISSSSESDEELEHTVADVTDEEIQENDETRSSKAPDAVEERGLSEENDRDEPKEASEQSITIYEYHYAKEEEDPMIGSEQTCPIADLIILEPPGETEVGIESGDTAITTNESKEVKLNGADQGDSLLDQHDIDSSPEVKEEIGGEGKEVIDTKESFISGHGQLDRPHHGVGEDETEVRSEINHARPGEGIHEEHEAEIESRRDEEGEVDLSQPVDHDEQPIIIASGESSDKSEPAPGTEGHEAAAGGSDDLASGPGSAETEPSAKEQHCVHSHVEAEDSSQACRDAGEGCTGVANDVAKSTEAEAEEADREELPPPSYVSEKESSDQEEFSGFAPKIRLDDFETQPEELKISKLLSDDFISTYLKSKVKIMRPIDPHTFETDGMLENSFEGRNLLKNNCGQEEFAHWTLKQQNHGWIVGYCSASGVQLPTRNAMGDPLPEFIGCNTYFETVNRMCKKEQTVNLIAEGCDAEYLDGTKARIEVSEWISLNENCKSTYELRVRILNEKKMKISDFDHDDGFSNTKDTGWRKIYHVFKGKECKGARYVSFSHGAVKWSGETGCRMSGTVVRLLPAKS